MIIVGGVESGPSVLPADVRHGRIDVVLPYGLMEADCSAVGMPLEWSIPMDPDVSAPHETRSNTSYSVPVLTIFAEHWLADDADLLGFDRAIHEREDLGRPFALRVVMEHRSHCQAIGQISVRYQRLGPIDGGSIARMARLRDVLRFHRALYDKGKPLVRADYDHAIDTWRWLLRLDPDVGEALQIAALFHDIERLWSEADVRVEQHADDYESFKRAHARSSAEKVSTLLEELGLPNELLVEVARLVGAHDSAGNASPHVALLNDADSLSFFSLNSWGYYQYFGDDQTSRKVKFTVQRMSDRALRVLPHLRYHPKVQACLMQLLETK
ncbi:MAG: DUF4202 family protein [Polyangiaceae bacterium]